MAQLQAVVPEAAAWCTKSGRDFVGHLRAKPVVASHFGKECTQRVFQSSMPVGPLRGFAIAVGAIDDADEGIEGVALGSGGVFAGSSFGITDRLDLRLNVASSAAGNVHWILSLSLEGFQGIAVIFLVRP